MKLTVTLLPIHGQPTAVVVFACAACQKDLVIKTDHFLQGTSAACASCAAPYTITKTDVDECFRQFSALVLPFMPESRLSKA